jgi:hypothetical protein
MKSLGEKSPNGDYQYFASMKAKHDITWLGITNILGRGFYTPQVLNIK